ncbi:protein CutA homolog isoform X2 [Diprion similis]|uniref:protein CutA homolog isoform X2 n=1 Tax=Diprion similis TaxID=362088 RepID=UPI001EF8ACDE|nr:protein CutA homolog isoform X2 [Diprion similis]
MSHTSAVFKFLMLSALVRNIHLLGCSTMSNISGIHSVAYVTVPSNEVAKNISRGLVKNKLAACVNIIPQITSIYEWKGEINEDQEILLMIKTRTEIVDALTKFIKENHPYEVCEVISLPVNIRFTMETNST